MRRLQTFPSTGGANSLSRWWTYCNPLCVYLNYIVIQACRHSPSLRLKNVFYRLIGVKIGHGASIATSVTLDFIAPELIEIGEGAIIGHNALILTHEFLVDSYRKGPTVIGPYALVGANSTVLAGVKIGARAQVGAMSLVHNDVPAGALVGGVPARIIKRIKSKKR
jgi:acetyltransferase-like isoleucine patch superfamily enzyme